MELMQTFVDLTWQKAMWIEIFDRAKKRKKIVNAKIGEYEFEYALINPEEGYGRDRLSTSKEPYEYIGRDVTFWIKDAEKESGAGLNEAGFAFVLERKIPRGDFANYVGLHEYIEATNFHTKKEYLHSYACKIDMQELMKKSPKFIDAYATWLLNMTKASKNSEKGYFVGAIPDFLKVIRKGDLSPTEVLKEFKKQLDLGYHLR